jgi:hypothetical protein
MADIQNEENKPGNLLYQKKNPGIFYITRLLEMTNKTKLLGDTFVRPWSKRTRRTPGLIAVALVASCT